MTKKPVEVDPRVAKQDAKNTVRNPIDAFIELITNSMDSYNRIKGKGIKIPKEIDGKIELYVSKTRRGKEQKGVIAVVDWAEGIPPDKMEKYIKGYGERSSGKETFRNIRGYFGRGLKDAAGGLDGIGTIQSVYNVLCVIIFLMLSPIYYQEGIVCTGLSKIKSGRGIKK